MPETSRRPSGAKIPSVRPFQPLRTATISWPRSVERRTTARMTALSPGQSPPPVRIPIRTPPLSDVGGVVLCEGGEAAVRDEYGIHAGALELRDVVRSRVAQVGDREFSRGYVLQQLEHDCQRVVVLVLADGQQEHLGVEVAKRSLEILRLGDPHHALEPERVRLVPHRK